MLCMFSLHTRCGDAAHLYGTGHMTSCPALWVNEEPLLSGDQVARHTLQTTTHDRDFYS